MITFTVEYDLTELKKLADNFAKNVQNAPEAALPNTAQAFKEATEAVRNMWVDVVSSMPGATSTMVKSILSKRNKDFDYSVYSDNRQLEQLNNGSKAVEYDMKKTHPYGKRSRVSKKGIPYLIIPFRWRTPGQSKDTLAHSQFFSSIIPTKIYNTRLKGLDVSKIITEKGYIEKNARGEDQWRNSYEWVKNSRLEDADAWDDRSRGMVRMLDKSRKDRITSTYFTFRIISANSPANSWIYKKAAKPALNFMQSLEQEARIKVDEIISKGIKADDEMYKNM